MRYLKLSALLSVILMCLTACGQTGALYLPDENPSENKNNQNESSQQDSTPVSNASAAQSEVS